jgi:hypothetical protein
MNRSQVDTSHLFKRDVTPHPTFQPFTAQRTPHTVRSCPDLYLLFIEFANLRVFVNYFCLDHYGRIYFIM